MLQSLQSATKRPPLVVRSYEALRHIHERRFIETDPNRFVRLWCEITHLCDVPPLEMHENARVDELCPPRRVFGLVLPHDALEEVTALVIVESRGCPPPRARPRTVGDVLDYLLEASCEPGVEKLKPNATKKTP